MENKKVFISYSWSSPSHEDWVLELANRLVQDGVDVILDKWDLREGHDKYHFMEGMVKSPEIHKVLIILDKKYSERADERKGGVGTETLIITPQLYADVTQEKFIPVVAEVDESGRAYLPVYLNGRIYIDLSSKDNFESNYEKLLRSIYSRPSLTKPALGKPPKYLFEDSPVRYKTTTLVRGLDVQLDKNPNRINSFLNDFLDEYFNCLPAFALDETVGTSYLGIGEAAFNKLTQYVSLKADYLAFLGKIFKSTIFFDHDVLIQFFEKLPMLFRPLDEKTNWQSYYYEHYKLIIYELFLYTIGLAIRYNNLTLLQDLFHSRYFIKDQYEGPKSNDDFTAFRYYYDMMDQYYKKLYNKNFYSPQADFIIHHIPEGWNRSFVINADLLCYYVAALNNKIWFPTTYIYKSRDGAPFDIISRLVSRKHFDKIKNILGFDDVEALKKRIVEVNELNQRRSYSHGFADPIPQFSYYIDVDKISTAL
ncbi:SEFIR domain-containing protein [Mucilaginibacter pedocola]|uniref:SEFIR domain-containing protein n=1 Tax=Mucilaginibacter pedocola TaxID=1792845 RepID=A0A1S9P7P6_9SPHI|nr:SEFIR domain-containing protein [Mucilaginibacter pedocola]OOQ56966.1 hypothetical protein BC343_15610 [Mucilaginibacter pedocola]